MKMKMNDSDQIGQIYLIFNSSLFLWDTSESEININPLYPISSLHNKS